MDTVIGVFMCVSCTINTLFTIFHIFGRTRLWLTAMRFAADTPRGKDRKTTNDWLKMNNITNQNKHLIIWIDEHVFSKSNQIIIQNLHKNKGCEFFCFQSLDKALDRKFKRNLILIVSAPLAAPVIKRISK